MKNILFFAAVIFCLYLSCTKNSGDIPPPLLAIHYIDSAGNDLFTDGNSGYYPDSVRIYDFENGNESLIYTPNAASPYGYSFAYAGSESLLQVFGNEDVVN